MGCHFSTLSKEARNRFCDLIKRTFIPMNITLHPLQMTDYASVCTIFSESFDESETKNFKKAWKERVPSMSIGAYAPYNQLVGFIIVEEGYYISYITVHPSFQKLQLGTRLLQCVLRKCVSENKSVTLIPVKDPGIVAWYKKNGFTEEVTKSGNSHFVMNFHSHDTRRNHPYLEALQE
jgi:ribosomal protein S18 acetylase RimI-like enzyme